MTDDEIIKALECCADQLNGALRFVANEKGAKEYYETLANALDLINRQKAENERLEKDSKRLKKVQKQLDDAMKMYSTIKAEAVKEFAEKLIQEDGYNNHTFDDCASILVPAEYRKGREEKIKEVWELIKEIKKEMVGDAE